MFLWSLSSGWPHHFFSNPPKGMSTFHVCNMSMAPFHYHRYGIPVNYSSFVMVHKPKSEKKMHDYLCNLFGHADDKFIEAEVRKGLNPLALFVSNDLGLLFLFTTGGRDTSGVRIQSV